MVLVIGPGICASLKSQMKFGIQGSLCIPGIWDKLAQFQSPILQNVENFLKRYFLHHHVRIMCSCASLSVNIY